MKTFKTVFLVALLTFAFSSFSQTTDEIEIDEIDDNEFIDHYSISDASFPGGVDSLVQFIKENMKYLDMYILECKWTYIYAVFCRDRWKYHSYFNYEKQYRM